MPRGRIHKSNPGGNQGLPSTLNLIPGSQRIIPVERRRGQIPTAGFEHWTNLVILSNCRITVQLNQLSLQLVFCNDSFDNAFSKAPCNIYIKKIVERLRNFWENSASKVVLWRCVLEGWSRHNFPSPLLPSKKLGSHSRAFISSPALHRCFLSYRQTLQLISSWPARLRAVRRTSQR